MKKNVEYFEWDDVKRMICEEMGIDEEYFRDYHKLIGGDYKDLWHAWMEYFDDNVSNGSIISVDISEDLESKLEWIENEGDNWLEPFVRAVYSVFEKNSIENVRYYW